MDHSSMQKKEDNASSERVITSLGDLTPDELGDLFNHLNQVKRSKKAFLTFINEHQVIQFLEKHQSL